MSTLPPYLLPLPHGITAIDTGFERDGFDSNYLMVEGGRAAFLDCGINSAVPRMMEALAAAGLRPEHVDWVIPTHVHLDHAGGAGLLMQHCPNATMLVHPRGARHMVDPSLLVAGASAVYGEDVVAKTYGDIVPVPAERVRESSDGMTIELAGRPLTLIDTPGHARHHHCIWDEASRGWFTGDTFGISYPEFVTPRGRYLFPTTTPVQFEPEALHASVDRMMQRQPDWLYLTHFGRVGDVARLAEQMHRQIDAMVMIARRRAQTPGITPQARNDAIKQDLAAHFRRALAALGSPLDAATIDALLALDVDLNAQGLGVWLDKPTR